MNKSFSIASLALIAISLGSVGCGKETQRSNNAEPQNAGLNTNQNFTNGQNVPNGGAPNAPYTFHCGTTYYNPCGGSNADLMASYNRSWSSYVYSSRIT